MLSGDGESVVITFLCLAVKDRYKNRAGWLTTQHH